MITFLQGTIQRNPTTITVNVNGVGYEVVVANPNHFKEDAPHCRVITRQVFTETSATLFGFPNETERELFDMLTKHVKGIGPKTAIAILSKIEPNLFKAAVANNDLATLSAVKGLGKKTAELILIELRDKVKVADLWDNSKGKEDQALNETMLSLIALGYSRAAAEKAAKDARKNLPDCEDTRELTRAALKN
jgi:Holliday junction DNA helicase RuvA